MPITTTVRIIIALAGQMEQPAPSARASWVSQTIYLRELPSPSSGAFALRVSEGDNMGEIQLAAAEAEQFASLLAQLPAHSMALTGMSFDGLTYELMIRQAEQTVTFQWQNDDWRSSPPDSRTTWEHVAALADFALNLAKKKEELS